MRRRGSIPIRRRCSTSPRSSTSTRRTSRCSTRICCGCSSCSKASASARIWKTGSTGWARAACWSTKSSTWNDEVRPDPRRGAPAYVRRAGLARRADPPPRTTQRVEHTEGEPMTRQLIIADRVISDDSDAYVIAEIGHNHQGSLKTAKELFQAAAECGVSAAKLQKRDNPSLYTREMYD